MMKSSRMTALIFTVLFLFGLFLGWTYGKRQGNNNVIIPSNEEAESKVSLSSIVKKIGTNQPITMKLLKKRITYNIIDDPDFIVFDSEFTNVTDKDIKAFTGVMHIYDVFDRFVGDMGFTYEEYLKVGETKQWLHHGIEYNQFREWQRNLLAMKEVKIVLEVNEVLFFDGSRKTY